MSIHNSTYNSYIHSLLKAKERMKRDRQIIRIIHKAINAKHLTPSEKNKLHFLLKKV